LNIILVTGANVPTRTLTVGWPYAMAGASMLVVALSAFALLINVVVNRWSAAGSSNVGYRIDPSKGRNAFHVGTDVPAGTGTPIVAAVGGRVVAAGPHPQYGRMVEIDHGNGPVTRYAHASQLNVRQGDVIVRGQRVAIVGSTGRSTGPPLHFEVRLNGVPQNPARILQASG